MQRRSCGSAGLTSCATAPHRSVLLQGMPQVDSDWSLVGGGSDDGAEPETPSEATRTRHAPVLLFGFRRQWVLVSSVPSVSPAAAAWLRGTTMVLRAADRASRGACEVTARTVAGRLRAQHRVQTLRLRRRRSTLRKAQR